MEGTADEEGEGVGDEKGEGAGDNHYGDAAIISITVSKTIYFY